MAIMANRIREIRKERGLTIEQLAEMAGLSRSYLTEIELGKKPANEIRLRQIASALSVASSDLLDDNTRQKWSQLTAILEGLSEPDQERLLRFAADLSASQASKPLE